MPDSHLTAALTGAATMAVIGAIDGAADNNAFGPVGRAGWKTALGALGVFMNVMGFLGRSQEKALKVYLGVLVGVAGVSVYALKQN